VQIRPNLGLVELLSRALLQNIQEERRRGHRIGPGKRGLHSAWRPVLRGSKQTTKPGYIKPVMAGNTESAEGMAEARERRACPAWLLADIADDPFSYTPTFLDRRKRS